MTTIDAVDGLPSELNRTRTREPIISELAHQLAGDVMTTLGVDQKFTPPGWCGAAMWLQAGLSSGWSPEIVRIAVAKIRARRNYQLPFSFRYLLQPILREHQLMAELSLPMAPVVVASQEERNHAEKTADRGAITPWQQSRDRWRAAAAKLNASVAADEGNDQ